MSAMGMGGMGGMGGMNSMGMGGMGAMGMGRGGMMGGMGGMGGGRNGMNQFGSNNQNSKNQSKIRSTVKIGFSMPPACSHCAIGRDSKPYCQVAYDDLRCFGYSSRHGWPHGCAAWQRRFAS